MSENRRVLLLVGSPRGKKSTSLSLGKYLCERLEEKDLSINYGFIHLLVIRKEKHEKLISLVNQANIIILSYPLYVDQLPSPVIKALEILHRNKEKIKQREAKNFLAIGNCGFPEASQIDLSLNICKNFSISMDFRWRGGIKVGGGEAIHGKDLNKRGKIVRNQKQGLNVAAEAILEDKNIPLEAIELASKDIIPKGLYKWMGNIGWRFRALKYWNLFNLKKKPYEVKTI
jgi:hypothetical protein